MLTTDQITETVLREIRALLEEAESAPEQLGRDDRLEDIGLDSLRLARLMIVLEGELGVDPFTPADDAPDDADVVDIFDVRTVGALVDTYVTALGAQPAVTA